MFGSLLSNAGLYWGTFLGTISGLLLSAITIVSNLGDNKSLNARIILFTALYIISAFRYFLRQNLEPYVEALESDNFSSIDSTYKKAIFLLNTGIVLGYGLLISSLTFTFYLSTIFIFLLQSWAALLLLIFTGFFRFVKTKNTNNKKAGLVVMLADMISAFISSGLFYIALDKGLVHIDLMLLIISVAFIGFMFTFEILSAYFPVTMKAIDDTRAIIS